MAACAFSDPANLANQCDLRVGFVSSTDGGATWSDPTYIAHMTLNELARTSQGLMVGDYSSAAVIPSGPYAGNSISAFSAGLQDQTQNQPIEVATHGLPITGGTTIVQTPSAAVIHRAKLQGGYTQKDLPPDEDHG